MKTNCLHTPIICLAVLLSCSLLCSAQERVLVVGDEELHFTPAPERGYVVKLRETTGGIKSLSSLSALDMDKAKLIRGLDKHGIWTVENDGSPAKNEKTMATLRQQVRAAYVAPLFSSNGETVAIIPEIVVRVRTGTEIEHVQVLCERIGCTIIKRMEFTEQEYLIEVLGIDADAVFAAIEQVNEISFVEWACPNTTCQLKLCGQIFPNDEYFPNQWHLHNTGQSGGTPNADINAPEAWEITTGDPNIIVAVVDSGVDTNHPDLVANLVPGYDFWEDDEMPDPAHDHFWDAHGTACAGLIAAQGNNSIGVTGVSWNCKVMPIRTGDYNAEGISSETQADVAEALRWAAFNGADILNNSWSRGKSPAPIIHSAIIDITEPEGVGREGKGCVVLFAAGNNGEDLRYPGKYPEVITVGATDHNDMRYSYSNFGSELDIVAPSGYMKATPPLAVWTTDITGLPGLSSNPILALDSLLDYAGFGGTSMACPIAAGVAALILSVDPNLTNEEVRSILYRSSKDLGDPGWDEYHGWGRVDAGAAVEMALNGMPLIYVDDDGPNDLGPNDPDVSDPNENGSAEHPFDAVQKAIDYAFPGETIVLLDGIYSGEGNWDIDFGGKAITVRSENGPESCIINCLGQGRGFDFQSGEGPDAVLEGVTITKAGAGKGAGIQIKDSSPTIRKCVLTGNSASMAGGGIAITGNSHPVIANCVFAVNSALLGGALNIETANLTLTNCTLLGNTALMGGGGIAATEAMYPELKNCILWNNVPGQIFGDATTTFCNVEGGWEGEGNLDVDPLFVDPANGDYHLQSEAGRWDPNSESWVVDDVTSPCIDAGDPNSDFSDEVWPHGGRINIGAYGGTTEASMSAEPTDMFLPRIACVHWDNSRIAENFQSFLQAYGCPVTLIRSEDLLEHALDDYDLIMIATGTSNPDVWVDEQAVTALVESGKPILGLGEGGYVFFGELGLTIGYPNGARTTFDSVRVLDPDDTLFSVPYPVAVPDDGTLQLSDSPGQHLVIYMWPAPPENVTVFAGNVDDTAYYPLVAEQGHLLWGFTESPEQMTEMGQRLFLNAVILTANARLEPETAQTP